MQDLSAPDLKLLEFTRAVQANPKLLLLDEPAAGVNVALLEKLETQIAEQTEEISVIEQEAKQEGRTLVMILAPKSTKSKKGNQPKDPKLTLEKVKNMEADKENPAS